jgi:hypothetical protein
MPMSTKKTPAKGAEPTPRFWSRIRYPRAIAAFKGSRSALTPGHRAAAPDMTLGALIYLLSLGLVAAATVGAFFGVGLMTAGSGARDSPPPPETEPPHQVAAAVLPVSPFLQNPVTETPIAPGISGSARGSVQEFSARKAPLSAAASASPGSKVPALRSTARKVKHARPSPTAPALLSTARDGILTPPMQTGPATLARLPGD